MLTGAGGEVRAVFLKYLIRTMKVQEEPLRRRLLDAMPDALRSRIRLSGRLEWMPVDCFAELLRVQYDAAGEAGSAAVFQSFFTDSLSMPLVRPLAQASVRLFGQTPAALARRTPQAWELVTRRSGEMSVRTESPNRLTFTAESISPALRHESFLPMFYGGFRTWTDFVGTEGKVTLHDDQLRHGRLDFNLEWT